MKRIVVIGHGMVGARFVEDIVAADPDVYVTVLGKEPITAYNRVLLSSVVAGTKSPEQAMKDAQAEAERILKPYR